MKTIDGHYILQEWKGFYVFDALATLILKLWWKTWLYFPINISYNYYVFTKFFIKIMFSYKLFQLKSHPTKKESFTKEFVCPTYKWINNVNTRRRCSHVHNRCNHDNDCKTSGEEQKCCFDGCVKVCRRAMTKRIKGETLQMKED